MLAPDGGHDYRYQLPPGYRNRLGPQQNTGSVTGSSVLMAGINTDRSPNCKAVTSYTSRYVGVESFFMVESPAVE